MQSDLLPRKMEVEGQYLAEALDIILRNPHSDNSSYNQILKAIFTQPTPHHVDITYDTDASAKGYNYRLSDKKSRRKHGNPTYALLDALNKLGEPNLGNIDGFRSSIMTPSTIAAAVSALTRARNSGKITLGGKDGEALRGSIGRAALSIAMTSATSAAISGGTDEIPGSDPRVLDSVSTKLRTVFLSHGAVHLQCPLLRPKLTRNQQHIQGLPDGGPAEIMNERGTVLILPDDLTASFARQCARGGSATACVKRFDINTVYQKGLAGGHPREMIEASFDIIYENPKDYGEYLEAETIMVLCQSIASIFPCGEYQYSFLDIFHLLYLIMLLSILKE